MMAQQQDADRVIAAYENARAATEYIDSIVLEMQQNSGTDYTFVWTNQYPTA